MRSILNQLRGWIEAAHPFPLAAVLLLTVLIALASAGDGEPDGGRLLLVLLAMLLSQLAIGWTNDYVDRESDHRYQPSKPIASGRLDARYLPLAIVAVTLTSLGLGVLLGLSPLLFLVIGTVAGLSYDLWLRQTHWSWLPYIVAFAVLPLYVWSSLDLFRSELLAGYVIALPLAPAAHIANVIPDMDADVAAGRRNLAVIWGRDLALRLMGTCLVAPLVLTAVSLPFIDYDLRALAPVVLIYVSMLVIAALCYWQRLEPLAFKVIVVASVLFVGGWLAAV